MKSNQTLDTLISLAQSRGLQVRRESLSRGVASGGVCVLKGIPTVFLDDRGKLDAQIDALAAVLRRFDWSDQELHPPIHSMLVRVPVGRETTPAPTAEPRKTLDPSRTLLG